MFLLCLRTHFPPSTQHSTRTERSPAASAKCAKLPHILLTHDARAQRCSKRAPRWNFHAARRPTKPDAYVDTQQRCRQRPHIWRCAPLRACSRAQALDMLAGAASATSAGRSAGACGHIGEQACLTSANSLASPAAPLPRALQRRSAPAAACLMVERTRACHLPLGVAGSLQAQTVRRVQRRGAGCCCRRRLSCCRGEVGA